MAQLELLEAEVLRDTRVGQTLVQRELAIHPGSVVPGLVAPILARGRRLGQFEIAASEERERQ